ncbi:hypothetical protein [Natrinema salsiterrestre]|uniref:Uncharacterized protein n=1 Tax=Natrinema salsiterrestre TaxID=2950540 RepID=A0A9Q4Q0G7_9EURY|nr:hypothetical protein [Natrinema salsiterrestre]MDF9746520.1 hypothetical protein [Natrinema salsiterrestre]
MGVRHVRPWWVVQELVDRARTMRETDRPTGRFPARAKRVSTYGGP